MTVDIGERAVKLQMQKYIVAIVGLVLVIMLYFARLYSWVDWFENRPFLPVSLGALGLYLLYMLYFPLRAISYVYVSDTALPGMLRVRFFRIQPLDDRKLSYEIPLHEFSHYREVRAWLGLRHFLYLYQRRGGQTYMYPPVSLTLLRRHELANLRQLLNQHVKPGAGDGGK